MATNVQPGISSPATTPTPTQHSPATTPTPTQHSGVCTSCTICQGWHIGSAQMQGRRKYMEDTFVVVDDLRSISAKTDTNPAGVQPAGGQTVAATLKGPQLARTTVFGVFDGHGGSEVAEEAAKVFPEVFRQTLQDNGNDVNLALAPAFLATDARIKDIRTSEFMTAGCTAVVCVASSALGYLFCANAGDSRAVACWNGFALAMSNDHKPTDNKEKARLTNIGARFDSIGRLMNSTKKLRVCRGFGDGTFKRSGNTYKHQVTAQPEITVQAFSHEMDFVIVASDGLWDVMTNEAAVDYVETMIAHSMDIPTPEDVARSLAMHAHALKSMDNITVLIAYNVGQRTPKNIQLRIRTRKYRKSTAATDQAPGSLGMFHSTGNTLYTKQ